MLGGVFYFLVLQIDRLEVEGDILGHGKRVVVYTIVGLERHTIDQVDVVEEGRLGGENAERRWHTIGQRKLLLVELRLLQGAHLERHLLHLVDHHAVVLVGAAAHHAHHVAGAVIERGHVYDLAEYFLENLVVLGLSAQLTAVRIQTLDVFVLGIAAVTALVAAASAEELTVE